MSDAPPFDAFPDPRSPDDHSHSGKQHNMTIPPHSVTPKMDHTNGSHDFQGHAEFPDQLQFGFNVPSPSPMSPHSSAAVGSSDEGSFLQPFDDDEEDMPRPMEHIIKWKTIRDQAIIVTGTDTYIPQSIYQPYTEKDRVRYIEKADLKEPITFKTAHPDQWGIVLEDALKAKMKNLIDKNDNMFENCGPSVSIRLQWPGYRAWTRQIPTMDFKSPKGPITRAKLAKNIAICVKRFIEEKEKERMEMEADRRWRVGACYIRMEDLILVSLHHISKGGWQPQLRLRTALSDIQLRRLQPQASLSIAY
ncbi:uncharacterized protein EDB93DRAFT_1256343 [Suillus bovinus]|uniref:uncharacterized protein n=1 Tax=Suillus bovinus TaxID=48563 RepID=UPI001B8846E7|nr:uncharacterized protein EDB93DRAFT_1256343 [Suillus bovinus]KAG2129216.1 hypothetical protein EDB93DRAFT_1256343 [Suillus bovinus]